MTMQLSRGDAGWRATGSEGIVSDARRDLDGEPAAVVAVALTTFWAPFIGPAYVESPFERREKPSETAGPQPVALGLEVDDRQIEQVFTDSVFAPRLTDFP
jgi:hypothetical protein